MSVLKVALIKNLNWTNGSYNKPGTIPDFSKFIEIEKTIPTMPTKYGGWVVLEGEWNYCVWNDVAYFLEPMENIDEEKKVFQYTLIRDEWINAIRQKIKVKGTVNRTLDEQLLWDNLYYTKPTIFQPSKITYLPLKDSKEVKYVAQPIFQQIRYVKHLNKKYFEKFHKEIEEAWKSTRHIVYPDHKLKVISSVRNIYRPCLREDWTNYIWKYIDDVVKGINEGTYKFSKVTSLNHLQGKYCFTVNKGIGTSELERYDVPPVNLNFTDVVPVDLILLNSDGSPKEKEPNTPADLFEFECDDSFDNEVEPLFNYRGAKIKKEGVIIKIPARKWKTGDYAFIKWGAGSILGKYLLLTDNEENWDKNEFSAIFTRVQRETRKQLWIKQASDFKTQLNKYIVELDNYIKQYPNYSKTPLPDLGITNENQYITELPHNEDRTFNWGAIYDLIYGDFFDPDMRSLGEKIGETGVAVGKGFLKWVVGEEILGAGQKMFKYFATQAGSSGATGLILDPELPFGEKRDTNPMYKYGKAGMDDLNKYNPHKGTLFNAVGKGSAVSAGSAPGDLIVDQTKLAKGFEYAKQAGGVYEAAKLGKRLLKGVRVLNAADVVTDILSIYENTYRLIITPLNTEERKIIWLVPKTPRFFSSVASTWDPWRLMELWNKVVTYDWVQAPSYDELKKLIVDDFYGERGKIHWYSQSELETGINLFDLVNTNYYLFINKGVPHIIFKNNKNIKHDVIYHSVTLKDYFDAYSLQYPTLINLINQKTELQVYQRRFDIQDKIYPDIPFTVSSKNIVGVSEKQSNFDYLWVRYRGQNSNFEDVVEIPTKQIESVVLTPEQIIQREMLYVQLQRNIEDYSIKEQQYRLQRKNEDDVWNNKWEAQGATRATSNLNSMVGIGGAVFGLMADSPLGFAMSGQQLGNNLINLMNRNLDFERLSIEQQSVYIRRFQENHALDVKFKRTEEDVKRLLNYQGTSFTPAYVNVRDTMEEISNEVLTIEPNDTLTNKNIYVRFWTPTPTQSRYLKEYYREYGVECLIPNTTIQVDDQICGVWCFSHIEGVDTDDKLQEEYLKNILLNGVSVQYEELEFGGPIKYSQPVVLPTSMERNINRLLYTMENLGSGVSEYRNLLATKVDNLANEKVQGLQTTINTQAANITTLGQTITTLNQKIKDLTDAQKKKLDEYKKKSAGYLKDFKNAKKEISKLESEVEKIGALLLKERKERKEQVKQLESHHDNTVFDKYSMWIHQAAVDVELPLKGYEEITDHLERDKRTLDDIVGKWKYANTNLMYANREVQLLRNDVTTTKNELNTEKGLTKSLNSQITTLNNEITQLNADLKKCKEAPKKDENEETRLKNRINALEKELRDLKENTGVDDKGQTKGDRDAQGIVSWLGSILGSLGGGSSITIPDDVPVKEPGLLEKLQIWADGATRKEIDASLVVRHLREQVDTLTAERDLYLKQKEEADGKLVELLNKYTEQTVTGGYTQEQVKVIVDSTLVYLENLRKNFLTNFISNEMMGVDVQLGSYDGEPFGFRYNVKNDYGSRPKRQDYCIAYWLYTTLDGRWVSWDEQNRAAKGVRELIKLIYRVIYGFGTYNSYYTAIRTKWFMIRPPGYSGYSENEPSEWRMDIDDDKVITSKMSEDKRYNYVLGTTPAGESEGFTIEDKVNLVAGAKLEVEKRKLELADQRLRIAAASAHKKQETIELLMKHLTKRGKKVEVKVGYDQDQLKEYAMSLIDKLAEKAGVDKDMMKATLDEIELPVVVDEEENKEN